MRFLRGLAVALALLGAAAGAVAWWGVTWYRTPGPSAAVVTVILPKHAGLAGAAGLLVSSGVLDRAWPFEIAERLTQSKGELKAGEYAVPPAVTPEALLALLRSGKTVVHRLTVPEGLTTAQVLALIDKAEALEGEVTAPPAEGTLFPSTYFYAWGDSRQGLVDRMRREMERTVAELWPGRHAGLPITDPKQAVTLASIVEKETARDDERPKIAGVFYNRLRLGMKLQSDPTAIYAVTGGKAPLGRAIDKADLAADSPYNTYVIDGLPPGPIDNPGRAALEAVLDPEDTDALYFVADGTGGHAFSAT
ncbi:MAG TPA: endolytic transglycosylase MltG, partial [Stellaceae bacterium]|nr:endolytic transglycosylase MltG [Stellaceae bacterium]